MATRKISQRTIKQMIKEGAAVDLDEMYKNNGYSTKKMPKPGSLQLIGTSYGAYGANGALFISKSGRMYAVASRSSTLFYYL